MAPPSEDYKRGMPRKTREFPPTNFKMHVIEHFYIATLSTIIIPSSLMISNVAQLYGVFKPR